MRATLTVTLDSGVVRHARVTALPGWETDPTRLAMTEVKGTQDGVESSEWLTLLAEALCELSNREVGIEAMRVRL